MTNDNTNTNDTHHFAPEGDRTFIDWLCSRMVDRHGYPQGGSVVETLRRYGDAGTMLDQQTVKAELAGAKSALLVFKRGHWWWLRDDLSRLLKRLGYVRLAAKLRPKTLRPDWDKE